MKKRFDPVILPDANPKGLYVILQHNQALHSLKGSTFFNAAKIRNIFGKTKENWKESKKPFIFAPDFGVAIP